MSTPSLPSLCPAIHPRSPLLNLHHNLVVCSTIPTKALSAGGSSSCIELMRGSVVLSRDAGEINWTERRPAQPRVPRRGQDLPSSRADPSRQAKQSERRLEHGVWTGRDDMAYAPRRARQRTKRGLKYDRAGSLRITIRYCLVRRVTPGCGERPAI